MLTAKNVVLSPRILDQAACDQLAASLKDSIDSAASRAQDLVRAVAQADATAKRLAVVSGAVAAAEAKAGEAAALYAAASRAAERAIHAEAKAEVTMRDRLAALDRAVAGFEARIERAVARLTSVDTRTLTPLTELCERTETLIGFAQDQAPGSLSDMIAAAQCAGVEARAAARDLDQIREQADHARALLAGAILDAAGAADAAARRQSVE